MRHVALEGVSFSYGGRLLLRDVDLALAPGLAVGVVGRNGCGKSTLVDVLVGLLAPSEGRVLVDGQDLAGLDHRAVRRHLGVVPQRPTFFSGSVLDNVVYGRLDCSRDDALEALWLAGAGPLVERLPHGVDTVLGEGALTLSGGEAQLVAVARALAGRPSVLVLDEPTNHLDVSRVAALREGLRGLPGQPALLLVSHDTSITSVVDDLYRWEEGMLVREVSGASEPLTDLVVR